MLKNKESLGELAGVLGVYRNGNYLVVIFDDGTKLRYLPDGEESFIPTFPESIDMNITNKCDLECEFCYASGSKQGEHADILDLEIFDSLHPHTEIAINGNDLTHPDLIVFLQRMKARDVYVGVTVSEFHFLKNIELLKFLEEKKLIRGVGVSISSDSNIDKTMKEVENFKTAVVHIVNGIVTKKTFKRLQEYKVNILILGYKLLGRGVDFHSKDVLNNKEDLKKQIEEIIRTSNLGNLKSISYDNLALEQLAIKDTTPSSIWDKFYMGDDGEFTMYIDLVDKTYASSSIGTKRRRIDEDIVNMFHRVKEGNI